MIVIDDKNNNKKICKIDRGEVDLVIVDDVFPSKKSGFRYIEFSAYLQLFHKSVVLSNGNSISAIDNKNEKLVFDEYLAIHPDFIDRVYYINNILKLDNIKLIYFIFLNNVYKYLSLVEASKIFFVFTLYPGGGFVLNDMYCDNRLRRVFRSPFFRKVIVTQKFIYDYLIKHKLCQESQIELIFGVVMPELKEKSEYMLSKKYYGVNKNILDICFVAHRYTKYGEDKGYDIFIEVAKKICEKTDNVYFHVAGSFDSSVINIDSIQNRIKFYGSLHPEEFDSFFKSMDIILSPNISGKISQGSFDGFPTASCIEAALRGVVIVAVDEFNSANGYFNNGDNIVIIQHDVENIVNKILGFYHNKRQLEEIGQAGCMQVQKLYGNKAQILSRINLLKKQIYDFGGVDKYIKFKVIKLNFYYYFMVVCIKIKRFFLKR